MIPRIAIALDFTANDDAQLMFAFKRRFRRRWRLCWFRASPMVG